VHQIVGFGLACRLARESLAVEATRQAALREQLWQRLSALGGVFPNAAAEPRLPGLLSLGFLGIEGESLLLAIDSELAVSSGSACNSAAAEPSYVLRALGLGDLAAQASLRLSLGRLTAAQDVERAADVIARAVRRLRWLAPPAALAAFPRPAAAIGDVPGEAARPGLDSPSAGGLEAAGAYSARVIELFRQLPCAGDLPAGPGEAWLGEAGDLAAGAWIRFELRVQQGVIVEAAFRAWGCPHVLAAAATVALRLPGLPPSLAAGLAPPRAIAAELDAPSAKLGRLFRVEDALQALRPARID
jgi:cysteine desulfurase